MPLRAQYVADVGMGPLTYPANAGQRVAEMYQTARCGLIGLPLAVQIWNVLEPIYLRAATGGLPVSQTDYDQLVLAAGLDIQTVLLTGHRGGFGIGQKIMNLFMKDLWALGIILPPVERLLHAPLDRIVLSKIRHVPKTWSVWTKVVASGFAAPEITDYLAVQQKIRAFYAASPIVFSSVIQMEQFIWHRI